MSCFQALRRVSILSSERYKGIRMEFADGQKWRFRRIIRILGEAVEEIEAEYKGKALSIGFNARYLIDVLGVLGGDGEIDIELKDELSPSVIRRPASIAIFMC